MTKKIDLTELYLDYTYLDNNLDEYQFPATNALNGRNFEFYLDNNTKYSISFEDKNTLVWEANDLSPQKESYSVVEIRPNVFLVDFLYNSDPKQSMTIVIDLVSEEVTLAWSKLSGKEEDKLPFLHERIKKNNDLSTIKNSILHGGIGKIRQNKNHQKTTELVGKRIQYTYSSEHIYEHIYINESVFAWHCLIGEGKGSAEVNPVNYIKISDQLYLFAWREVIASCFGLVVIDLKQNRSTGKLYWNKPGSQDVTYVKMGSYAKVLSETLYE